MRLTLPRTPATLPEPNIVKRGYVSVTMRWQRVHDAWRNSDRDLRWYGKCIGCERNLWAFDDGENDPRGMLGDNALWSISEDHGPDSRTCAICANDYSAYRACMRRIDRDAPPTWCVVQWPEA